MRQVVFVFSLLFTVAGFAQNHEADTLTDVRVEVQNGHFMVEQCNPDCRVVGTYTKEEVRSALQETILDLKAHKNGPGLIKKTALSALAVAVVAVCAPIGAALMAPGLALSFLFETATRGPHGESSGAWIFGAILALPGVVPLKLAIHEWDQLREYWGEGHTIRELRRVGKELDHLENGDGTYVRVPASLVGALRPVPGSLYVSAAK